jgi:hypothetical protein
LVGSNVKKKYPLIIKYVMKNNESILERNEKRGAIRNTIIVILVALLINYICLFPLGFIKLFVMKLIIGVIDLAFVLGNFSYFINLFFKFKPSALSLELEKLKELSSDYYYEEYRKRIYSVVEKETCPKCGKSDQVVDKIRRIQGKEDGEFFLGFGSFHGSIDTSPIKHCNSCGNEWIKKETSYSYSQDSSINDLLWKMYDFFKNGIDNNSDPLKKFSAKAIKHFIDDNENNGYIAKELSELSTRHFKKYGCS